MLGCGLVVDVHLRPQPRIDVLVTDFATEERRLRTDYAGVAWLGDEPDAESGLLGSEYTRRDLETQLFLPDTHWYDADALDGVEVQVTAGVLQVAPTRQGTQGLLGALTEPEIEFYEHPGRQGGRRHLPVPARRDPLQRRPVVPGDAGLRPGGRPAAGCRRGGRRRPARGVSRPDTAWLDTAWVDPAVTLLRPDYRALLLVATG